MWDEANPRLIGRSDAARALNIQGLSIGRMQRAAHGTFQTCHIGKVDQRCGRLEALQKFRKAFAIRSSQAVRAVHA